MAHRGRDLARAIGGGDAAFGGPGSDTCAGGFASKNFYAEFLAAMQVVAGTAGIPGEVALSEEAPKANVQ